MKRLLGFFVLFFAGMAMASARQSPDSLVSKLQAFTATHPQEKVYLHLDRSFYHIGDTIWFKAYLMNARGNELSSISKVIHVEVKGPEGKVTPLMLPVISSMAAGQLPLSDSLFKAGDYQIRAYTQWMRNAGEDFFFTHTVPVGDMQGDKGLNWPNVEAKGSSSGLHADKSDSSGLHSRTGILSLAFFPEGGVLVEGIRTKVGFKALDSKGWGLGVKGYIETRQGEQVALFESGYAGMGTFSFTPRAGDSYRAVLVDGEHAGQRFDLPKAQSEGVALSVNPVAGDSLLLIRISRTASWKALEKVILLVQSHGEVSHALELPIGESSVKFTLPVGQLAEGIHQLTLFSSDNLPLAERLVFIKRQETIHTILRSDKAVYSTRDKVQLDLSVNDAQARGIVGGYSVSVIRSTAFDLPEAQQLSIYASVLLQADLRGHIETPNYYFTNYDAQKAAELDALLLTQGWRRFSWKQVLQEAPVVRYRAEQGLQLSGRVSSGAADKPVAGARVNLLAAKEMLFLDTLADQQGYFSFKDLQLADSTQLILRARGARAGSNVKIVLDSVVRPDWPQRSLPFRSSPADTVWKGSLLGSAGGIEQMEERGRIRQGTTLKTVEIITKKRAPEIKGSVYPFAAAPPDYTFEPDQLQEMVNLETHLRGLKGVSIVGKKIFSSLKDAPMTILLNGIVIEDLSGIDPRSLIGVQIILAGKIAENMASALLLMPGSTKNGIVFLTMAGMPDKFLKVDRPSGLLQHTFTGYTYAREFYAPHYETQKVLPQSDFRSTLFWKPDIITTEEGKATFDFYTSDEPGRYKVTLEGVGANGQLTRKISYFEVK